MKCNHEKYLESEEISCRRLAKYCNEGTQAEQEWIKTAEALLQRRREHIKVCLKCGE